MSSAEIVATSHAGRLLDILADAPVGRADRLRVLVVDTDSSSAAALHTHLPHTDTEVLFASTIEATRELLAAKSVDLIVCNPRIAEDMGGRFFAQLTEHAASTGMSVIALKSDAAKPDDAELYAMGADAILHRDIKCDALVSAVRSHLQKISHRHRHLLQDPVTGCPNVSVFREAFQRASFLAAREHEPLSMLVLHVGALGRIRRERGIPAADEVMHSLAGSVADSLRKSDLLARGSGNSLLTLLPVTDQAGAQRVVEKLNDRLVRASSLSEALDGADLLLSVGIAAAAPHASFDEVLETALSFLQPMWSSVERACTVDAHPTPKWMPRILIAEDDGLTASIIRHRLERLGYGVIHASDGAELLRVAPEAGASLWILDVKMPYVDGFEALRRLRSIRSLRDVPVLMLTSMGNEEDIARGFELGADDYLVKPFSPLELQARVQRLLRTSS